VRRYSPGVLPPQPSRVLIEASAIAARAAELARAIASDHAGEPPCLVAVIEGARTFAGLLMAQLPARLPLRTIAASSYGKGTESHGEVRIHSGDDIDAVGRHVLLIEDIVDTGRTVTALRAHFMARGAKTVAVATLLDKPARRRVPVEIAWCGFQVPDVFVVGCGMDLAGKWRELPDVVALAGDAAS
jgi:hypoxanthine phosphoribosyltransferase